MEFTQLKFDDISETHGEGAIQAYVELPNGYDVSVVKHKYSYGSEKGLYEMGVFRHQGMMCDPLGWGDTVKGYLDEECVERELNLIIELGKKSIDT